MMLKVTALRPQEPVTTAPDHISVIAQLAYPDHIYVIA